MHRAASGGQRAASRIDRTSVARMGVVALFIAATAIALTYGQPAIAQTHRQPAAAPAPAPKTIVLFPVDTRGGVSDQLADSIIDVAKGRLLLSGEWRPLYLSSALPTVRKALLDGTITQSQLNKPTDSDSTIKTLTQLTGENRALIFSIDSYEYEASKNQVNLVMSVRLLDFTGGKPRGAAESASSPANAPSSHKEFDVASELARSLTEKLMTTLIGAPKAVAAPPSGKNRH